MADFGSLAPDDVPAPRSWWSRGLDILDAAGSNRSGHAKPGILPTEPLALTLLGGARAVGRKFMEGPPSFDWGAFQGPSGERDDPLRERQVAAALPLALSMIGGGTSFAQRGALGVFGGRLAQTADHAALAKAEELAAKGAPREQIWNDTGWFKGADDKWRFEIPDNGSTFKGDGPIQQLAAKRGGTAGDVFAHHELYDAYPNMKAIEVDGGLLPSRASYSRAIEPGDTERIMINDYMKGGDSPRSSMLHELQHGVQGREGFAAGGNSYTLRPNTPAWDIYRERLEAMTTPLSHEGFSRAANYDGMAPLKDYNNYLKQVRNPSPMAVRAAQDYAVQQGYHRAAGEVESRNVQTRMNYTPEQRKSSPPWTTEDVPREQQIVRFGDAGPQASVPLNSLTNAAMMAVPGARIPRPAQAQQMGFRTNMPLYHGAAPKVPFSEFDPAMQGASSRAMSAREGIWTTTDPEMAASHAMNASAKTGGAPQTYPLVHRADKPASIQLRGDESEAMVANTLRDAFE